MIRHYIILIFILIALCGIASAEEDISHYTKINENISIPNQVVEKTKFFTMGILLKDTNGYQPVQLNDSFQQYYNDTENIISFYWDFGNGDISTLQSPQELYNKTGSYNVTEVYTNSSGSENIISNWAVNCVIGGKSP